VLASKLPTESPPTLGAHRNRLQSTGAAWPGTAFQTHSSLRSDGMRLPEFHASFTHVERERSALSIEARICQEIEFTLQSIDPQQTQVRPDGGGHIAVFDRIDGVARESELCRHIFLTQSAALARLPKPGTECFELRGHSLRDKIK